MSTSKRRGPCGAPIRGGCGPFSTLWPRLIRCLAILVQPFVPAAAEKLLDQLSVPEGSRDFAALAAAPLVAGTPLPKPVGIFPRFVEAPAA